ncbi:AP-2 complex subunit sigma [Capsicum annuum]|nr:AP-2 complex subunit sigma [Capsicum annuum]
MAVKYEEAGVHIADPSLFGTEIRFILLQNRQGKTRLAKYYIPLEESEKHKVEYEVHRLVVNRDPKFTNFVEFRTHKVIYRRYAGLFFSLCVDITDNELAYLESIHLFVEILDHFFSNVCELDLVFNFHKVYLILDEFILAGELQETSNYRENGRIGKAGVKIFVLAQESRQTLSFAFIVCTVLLFWLAVFTALEILYSC